MNKKSQKGQIFLMALVISASISAIALGMSSIILSGAQQAADVGHYIPAFYAADAGAERALYRLRIPIPPNTTTPFSENGFLNGVSNNVCVSLPNYSTCNNTLCPASVTNYCIFSTGTFGTLGRVLQVSY